MDQMEMGADVEMGADEDEGESQPVVFTERLKSGYSTARNDVLKRIWEERQKLPEKWKAIGPDNLGGRVTCLIAKSGTGGQKLLAGAACGGVWDGNVTGPDSKLHCDWAVNPAKPKNSRDETFLIHNIGALAVDGKTIYCGTGNAYYSGDSFPGVGLFRSDNDGQTWTQLQNTSKDFPRRVSTIAVDGDHVWIGGVVLPQEDESEQTQYSGIFRSSNKGETWDRETFQIDKDFARKFAVSVDEEAGLFEERDYQCHSIVFLENGAKAILAALTAPLGWGGIWRSRNGGKTWEQLTRGLPSPREFGRTTLAVAKTRSQNVVYAFIGAADGRCLGVYRSCDGGDHWVGRGKQHFAAVSKLNYVNCLAVSPADPDIVVCGARDLHRSVDGGQTWTQITEWFAARNSRGYSHADHHALLWPEEKRLYSSNDGGVDVSHDNGITWRNLTDGLAVTMFYDIDVAASFGSKNSPNLIIAGGAQDNASVMTDFRAAGIGYVPTCLGVQLGLNQRMAGGAAGKLKDSEEVIVNFDGAGMSDIVSTPGVQLISSSSGNARVAHDFKEILDGDGGWTVFDPSDPLHVYGSSQNMTIYRHRRINGWQEVTPEDAGDDERNRIWMAIIAMHPRDPNIVFTGSTRVWRTNNDGDTWTAVSDDLDGSPISAIEIADNNPNFIYVGTVNGNIFKSEDGGNRWTDEPGEREPKPMEWRKDLQERLSIGVARTITRIEAHPNNARRIAVTLMGFDRKHFLPHVLWFDGDTGQKQKRDESKRKWIDLSDSDRGDNAALPNLHHNVITWDQCGEYLFVGNDIGVWALKFTGDSFAKKNGRYDWVDISAGLPNALVTDLVYHCRSKSLTAATYGRSLYWTDEKTWTR